MKRKICFRADASAQIGYGHFIRTLALADMLKDEFDCVFFTSEPTPYQKEQMEKVCRFAGLCEESKFEDFLANLDGTEIVVLDNYFFTTDYQRQIKAKGCKLVCIDDIHDKHYVADVVVNHALTDSGLFDCEPYTQLCLGFDYALLRAPFLKAVPQRQRNSSIVVNFGGADPFGVTERIVTILLELSIPYRVIVVLGDKVHLSEGNRQKVTVCRNLSAEQMAELFETSAAGILSASTVCIEALSRNLPLIVGYHVDNQKEIYHILAKTNMVQPLGLLQETSSGGLSTALQNLKQSEPFLFPVGIKDRFIRIFNSLR